LSDKNITQTHYFLEQEVSCIEGLCRGSIHPSVWKVNSANFALTEFYEVQQSFRTR
jgi:hypothetical protein